LQVWFWATYLAATHHPGISATQLQRQLGIKRYETAWPILHKLHRAMVALERSLLRGPVEVDEFYVGGIEAGRGAGRRTDSSKAIVVVAVELRGLGSGRLLLGVVPDLSNGALCGFVEEAVNPGAIVHTDAWQGYRRLGVLGYDHRPASQRQSEPGEWLLPRAHRSISNLKAWLHGTHRDVSREHLQVYLDEFVFRHNRRRTPMAAFQTLLGLGAGRPPTTYREITAHAA
jgi:transposase-like protein